jgi:hypothetical protein
LQIRCFFKSSPIEGAYIAAIVESERVHLYGTVEFLVDTGATRTTISDKDVIRLGLDYAKLDKLQGGVLGVGGTVDTFILTDAMLMFNAEKIIQQEPLEQLYFLKHSTLNDKILRIPSVLGRDILNKYAFIYDKRQEIAYITDKKSPK